MRQFTDQTNDAIFDGLERALEESWFVEFNDQELPPGCIPDRANICIHKERDTGLIRVSVEPGVEYFGLSPAIRRWFDMGEICFPNSHWLKKWFHLELKEDFERSLDSINFPLPPFHAESTVIDAVALGPAFLNECADSVDSLTPDFIFLLVRQFGAQFGLAVHAIDNAVCDMIANRCSLERTQTFTSILIDLLGSELVAQVSENVSQVTVEGPPISWVPLSGH